ncbi:hypothetical protein CBA19CS11_35600 [Caballeronia novacaledonica]|uniref:dynamin family protein n=1 Tax=Caballeronia novacaledonica TaxID=1544861 RepID=UPI001EE33674|nr:dynamin family protein [Caballeronia novacaledonica]GJH14280.1 hypothetical protein CBA19CS11_35600 [Caballeronia novacaledonica]
MAKLFEAGFQERIERLANFFVMRRRPLRDAIVAQIADAQTRHGEAEHARQSAENGLERLKADHDDLTKKQIHGQRRLDLSRYRYGALATAHRDIRSELQRMRDEHDAAIKQGAAASERLRARETGYEALSNRHAALDAAHATVLGERASLASAQAVLQEQHATLAAGHAKLSSEHAALIAAHAEAQAQLQHQRKEQHRLVVQFNDATAALGEAHKQNVHLAGALDERSGQLRHAEDEREQVASQLAAVVQELDETRNSYEAAVSEAVAARNSLRDQFNDLDARHHALTEENAGRKWRENLVARLFSRDRAANRGLAAFGELMAGYLDVTQAGAPVLARAIVLQELKSIYGDLEQLTRAGGGARRKMLAIGGGFSSGKSEFINSFIDDPAVQLKVGMQPVTAIPTYVFAAQERAISVMTSAGSLVELDAAQLQELSAASLSQCEFDMKSLMHSLQVGVPMDPKRFGHLCLVDTPGFNAPASSRPYAVSDRETAREAVSAADALIWVMAAEVNGTMSQSDLEFIHECQLGARPLYVVLNKADLRSEEQLADILDEVEFVLNSERIAYKGISLYSSVLREEVAFRKKSLYAHFVALKRGSGSVDHLLERTALAFANYADAIKADIRTARARESAIRNVEAEALAAGGEELYELMHKRVRKLDMPVDVDSLKLALKHCDELHQRFIEAIEMALAEAN